MINYQKFYVVLIALWWGLPGFVQIAYGQLLDQNLGSPLIQSYSPKRYKSHQRVWSIVQDKKGLMYFGTNIDVVLFDGIRWLRIPTPNNQPVFSMTVDDKGVVYLGLAKDFGYLAADRLGQPKFVSLLSQIKDKRHQEFSAIRKVFSTPNGIYFISKEKIFRFYQNKLNKVWQAPSQESFVNTYLIHQNLYVCQSQGISQINENSIQALPQLTQFKSVQALVPTKDAMLVVDQKQGTWQYTTQTQQISRFNPSFEKIINTSAPIQIQTLSDSLFALGLTDAGVLIIDKQGNIKHHLRKKTGLASDRILCLYTAQNNLWIGTQYGITRITINASLAQHNETTGITSLLGDVKTFRGKTYITSVEGLFVIDNGRLKPILGIRGSCSTLCYFKALVSGTLFVKSSQEF